MAGNSIWIDFGWKKINRELKLLDGAFTKVGLPEGVDVKSPSKKGSGRKPISSSSELIRIAAANEFGTKRIPPRAAMKQAFDGSRPQVEKMKERIVDKIYGGTMTARRGIGLLGEFGVNKVKRQITKLKSPANALSTIKRKKSSNPLIDRSQYRNSITHLDSI